MEVKTMILVTAVLLSACGAGGTAVETRVQIERVPVRAPCPDPETYKGLKADRPRPLAEQAMPATADVRNAKMSAQLGRYEARGGWADRVERVLDRCQQGD